MTEWVDQPITRADIEEAVDRYLPPSHPDHLRTGFIEHNARSWEGVLWRDAGAWNLATEWLRYSVPGV